MKRRNSWNEIGDMGIPDVFYSEDERNYFMKRAGIKPSYPTTSSLDAGINDNPHYSDKNFDHKEQTIFGKEQKELEYNYSDRIWQWDYSKAENASKAAKESGAMHNTARWHQEFLRSYFDRPDLELKHIIAGVNWSNGYAYLVYGYTKQAK